MNRKYSFGWSDKDAVECPELDALLGDLEAVCKRFGVSFELESGYDEPSKLLLIAAKEPDLSFLADHVSDFDTSVPWLAAAKRAYDAKRAHREHEEQQQERARREDAIKAQQATALRDGVLVGGKRYKLVEAE
jgi:hypothetical protein